MVVPSAFRKGMALMGEDAFVLRRNIFEQCIDVYPKKEWLNLIVELRTKLSWFDREQSQFKREFFRGVIEVEMDANGRMLIPKKMLEDLDIQSDIVMVGQDVKMEIWGQEVYEKNALSVDHFVNLTAEIFGSKNKE